MLRHSPFTNMGAWDGLRYFIVALPEPSINYYANNLILIFMNINENIKSIENRKKLRRFTYKITDISAASCPRAASTVPKSY